MSEVQGRIAVDAAWGRTHWDQVSDHRRRYRIPEDKELSSSAGSLVLRGPADLVLRPVDAESVQNLTTVVLGSSTAKHAVLCLPAPMVTRAGPSRSITRSPNPKTAGRCRCQKFGQIYANGLRRRRPCPGDKWHLDEVFIRINGQTHYLWRAVDQDGVVLDILVQPRRNAAAAKRFFRAFSKDCGTCRE